jgi:hypothetical protein
MDLKNIIRKVIIEAHEKKILNEEKFKIYDISNSSRYRNENLKSDKFFILHHTAGRGTAQQIVTVLNTRKDGPLGIQYIIDREAKVYKGTKGTKGAHISSLYSSAKAKGISNSTAQGVEIIANNDSDVLISQCRSALLLVKSLGYSLGQVYGHGEVSSNKEPNEGATCKAYFKKYWDKTESEMPTIDNSLNVSVPDSEKIKAVEPAKSSDYLKYMLQTGKIFNPASTFINTVIELPYKTKNGEKIFGFRRKSDKKVFLFYFETVDKIKYLEIDWETYQQEKDNIPTMVWGTLNKNNASGGNVKSKKSSTQKSEVVIKSDKKSKKEGKTPKNIIIGDSQTPYVDKNTSKAEMVPGPEGENTLHQGSTTVNWLRDAVKKYPNSPEVENVILCTGTNGGFGNFQNDVDGLFSAVNKTFPNAKIYAVQGSWGWGGNKKYDENDVRNYYKKYQALGATLIEPPIGGIEPHGNKPVYKKIGANIDSKL